MTALNLFKKPKAEKPKTKAKAKPVVSETVATPAVEGQVVRASVIKRVYVSEKASQAKAFNQYVFEVTSTAVRPEIRKEIEKKYGVKVTKINILNRVPKKITVGRYQGVRSGFRKAMVTLQKGQTIAES